ncbi:MAG: adenylate/guanylate cyclase domain-containing protein [Methylohalobius crimeensis]
MVRPSALLRIHPALICVLLAHLVFFLIIGLRWGGHLQALELAVYDRFLNRRAQTKTLGSRIVLIGITEKDFERSGWPLSDALLRMLLQKLLAYQPRVIGLDLYRDKPIPWIPRQREYPDFRRLNQLLARHRSIIGVMKFQDIPPPPGLRADRRAGFNDVIPDREGVVRRGLLFLDDGRKTFYSFPLMLALEYLKEAGVTLLPGASDPAHVRLGQATIPPFQKNDGGYIEAEDRGYQFLLDYGGAPQTFPLFSLTDLLSENIALESVRDKIAIVGIVAKSEKDFFYTPLSGSRTLDAGLPVYGIELHGYITSQLLRLALDGDTVVRTLDEFQEIGWIGLWCLLGAVLGFRGRALLGFTLLALSGWTLLFTFCYLAFQQAWWIPLIPPVLGWTIALSSMTAYLSGRERMERIVLMGMFSRYVPPNIAQDLWQQREEFLQGGRPRPQRLTGTVLFTDLKGFTSVSEKSDPQELMDWLNIYMESMVKIVMDHQGVVDKFIGDAVMAVFGVPLARTRDDEIGRDALRAVQCAVAMGRKLEALNRDWRQQGLPSIGMRIGIHTGPMVAGSLGSRDRLEYTVIGDTVNTAARLESFNKNFFPECGWRILVGESTWGYVAHHFETEPVGAVSLKGKDKKITIYRVLGERKGPSCEVLHEQGGGLQG